MPIDLSSYLDSSSAVPVDNSIPLSSEDAYAAPQLPSAISDKWVASPDNVRMLSGVHLSPNQISALDGGKEYLDVLKSQQRGPRGFVEALSDISSADAPFVGDIVGSLIPIREMRNIANTFRKLDEGSPISDQEALYAQLYLADAERKGQATLGGKVGDVTRAMPGFMAEIAAYTAAGTAIGAISPDPVTTAVGSGGGLAAGIFKVTGGALRAGVKKGLTKKASNKAAKAALKYLTKAAGAEYTAALTKGAIKLAEVGTFTALADTGVNALANTAMGRDAMASRGAEERLIQAAIEGDDLTVRSAQMMAMADRWIEYYSEASGEMISGALVGPVAGKLGKLTGREGGLSLAKMFDRVLGKAGTEAADVAGKAASTAVKGPLGKVAYLKEKLATSAGVKMAVDWLSAGGDLDTVAKRWAKAGYDGWAEEILEERVGGFTRGLLGLEGDTDRGQLADAWSNMWPDKEQFMVEAISFAIPLGIKSAAQQGHLALSGQSLSEHTRLVKSVYGGTNPAGEGTLVEGDNQVILDRRGREMAGVDEIATDIARLAEIEASRPTSIPGKIADTALTLFEMVATGQFINHPRYSTADQKIGFDGKTAFVSMYTQVNQRLKDNMLKKGVSEEDATKQAAVLAKESVMEAIAMARKTFQVKGRVYDALKESGEDLNGLSYEDLRDKLNALTLDNDSPLVRVPLDSERHYWALRNQKNPIADAVDANREAIATVLGKHGLRAGVVDVDALASAQAVADSKEPADLDRVRMTPDELPGFDLTPEELDFIINNPFSEQAWDLAISQGIRLTDEASKDGMLSGVDQLVESAKRYQDFVAKGKIGEFYTKQDADGNDEVVTIKPAGKGQVRIQGWNPAGAASVSDISSATNVMSLEDARSKLSQRGFEGRLNADRSYRLTLPNQVSSKNPRLLANLFDYGAMSGSTDKAAEKYVKDTLLGRQDSDGNWFISIGALNSANKIATSLDAGGYSMWEDSGESALKNLDLAVNGYSSRYKNPPAVARFITNAYRAISERSDAGDYKALIKLLKDSDNIEAAIKLFGYAVMGYDQVPGNAPFRKEIGQLKEALSTVPGIDAFISEMAGVWGMLTSRDGVTSVDLTEAMWNANPLLNVQARALIADRVAAAVKNAQQPTVEKAAKDAEAGKPKAEAKKQVKRSEPDLDDQLPGLLPQGDRGQAPKAEAPKAEAPKAEAPKAKKAAPKKAAPKKAAPKKAEAKKPAPQEPEPEVGLAPAPEIAEVAPKEAPAPKVIDNAASLVGKEDAENKAAADLLDKIFGGSASIAPSEDVLSAIEAKVEQAKVIINAAPPDDKLAALQAVAEANLFADNTPEEKAAAGALLADFMAIERNLEAPPVPGEYAKELYRDLSAVEELIRIADHKKKEAKSDETAVAPGASFVQEKNDKAADEGITIERSHEDQDAQNMKNVEALGALAAVFEQTLGPGYGYGALERLTQTESSWNALHKALLSTENMKAYLSEDSPDMLPEERAFKDIVIVSNKVALEQDENSKGVNMGYLNAKLRVARSWVYVPAAQGVVNMTDGEIELETTGSKTAAPMLIKRAETHRDRLIGSPKVMGEIVAMYEKVENDANLAPRERLTEDSVISRLKKDPAWASDYFDFLARWTGAPKTLFSSAAKNATGLKRLSGLSKTIEYHFGVARQKNLITSESQYKRGQAITKAMNDNWIGVQQSNKGQPNAVLIADAANMPNWVIPTFKANSGKGFTPLRGTNGFLEGVKAFAKELDIPFHEAILFVPEFSINKFTHIKASELYKNPVAYATVRDMMWKHGYVHTGSLGDKDSSYWLKLPKTNLAELVSLYEKEYNDPNRMRIEAAALISPADMRDMQKEFNNAKGVDSIKTFDIARQMHYAYYGLKFDTAMSGSLRAYVSTEVGKISKSLLMTMGELSTALTEAENLESIPIVQKMLATKSKRDGNQLTGATLTLEGLPDMLKELDPDRSGDNLRVAFVDMNDVHGNSDGQYFFSGNVGRALAKMLSEEHAGSTESAYSLKMQISGAFKDLAHLDKMNGVNIEELAASNRGAEGTVSPTDKALKEFMDHFGIDFIVPTSNMKVPSKESFGLPNITDYRIGDVINKDGLMGLDALTESGEDLNGLSYEAIRDKLLAAMAPRVSKFIQEMNPKNFRVPQVLHGDTYAKYKRAARQIQAIMLDVPHAMATPIIDLMARYSDVAGQSLMPTREELTQVAIKALEARDPLLAESLRNGSRSIVSPDVISKTQVLRAVVSSVEFKTRRAMGQNIAEFAAKKANILTEYNQNITVADNGLIDRKNNVVMSAVMDGNISGVRPAIYGARGKAFEGREDIIGFVKNSFRFNFNRSNGDALLKTPNDYYKFESPEGKAARLPYADLFVSETEGRAAAPNEIAFTEEDGIPWIPAGAPIVQLDSKGRPILDASIIRDAIRQLDNGEWVLLGGTVLDVRIPSVDLASGQVARLRNNIGNKKSNLVRLADERYKYSGGDYDGDATHMIVAGDFYTDTKEGISNRVVRLMIEAYNDVDVATWSTMSIEDVNKKFGIYGAEATEEAMKKRTAPLKLNSDEYTVDTMVKGRAGSDVLAIAAKSGTTVRLLNAAGAYLMDTENPIIVATDDGETLVIRRSFRDVEAIRTDRNAWNREQLGMYLASSGIVNLDVDDPKLRQVADMGLTALVQSMLIPAIAWDADTLNPEAGGDYNHKVEFEAAANRAISLMKTLASSELIQAVDKASNDGAQMLTPDGKQKSVATLMYDIAENMLTDEERKRLDEAKITAVAEVLDDPEDVKKAEKQATKDFLKNKSQFAGIIRLYEASVDIRKMGQINDLMFGSPKLESLGVIMNSLKTASKWVNEDILRDGGEITFVDKGEDSALAAPVRVLASKLKDTLPSALYSATDNGSMLYSWKQSASDSARHGDVSIETHLKNVAGLIALRHMVNNSGISDLNPMFNASRLNDLIAEYPENTFLQLVTESREVTNALRLQPLYEGSAGIQLTEPELLRVQKDFDALPRELQLELFINGVASYGSVAGTYIGSFVPFTGGPESQFRKDLTKAELSVHNDWFRNMDIEGSDWAAALAGTMAVSNVTAYNRRRIAATAMFSDLGLNFVKGSGIDAGNVIYLESEAGAKSGSEPDLDSQNLDSEGDPFTSKKANKNLNAIIQEKYDTTSIFDASEKVAQLLGVTPKGKAAVAVTSRANLEDGISGQAAAALDAMEFEATPEFFEAPEGLDLDADVGVEPDLEGEFEPPPTGSVFGRGEAAPKAVAGGMSDALRAIASAPQEGEEALDQGDVAALLPELTVTDWNLLSEAAGQPVNEENFFDVADNAVVLGKLRRAEAAPKDPELARAEQVNQEAEDILKADADSAIGSGEAPAAAVNQATAPVEKLNPTREEADALDSNILTARRDTLLPTVEQAEALQAIAEFLKSDAAEAELVGYAGTGKTTMMENVVRHQQYLDPSVSVSIWALSNQATNIVRGKMEANGVSADISTIHKGLFGEKDPETDKWVPRGLTEGSFIIIDESSMVDKDLYETIKSETAKVGARVLYVGDNYQIEPVGAPSFVLHVNKSPIPSTFKTTLSGVMRQASDSDVLVMATKTRQDNVPSIPVGAGTEQFKIYDTAQDQKFIRDYQDDVKRDSEQTIMVTATNRQRNMYNRYARKALFGADANNMLNEGDRLMGVANAVGVSNSELFTVTEAPASESDEYEFTVQATKGSGKYKKDITVPVKRVTAQINTLGEGGPRRVTMYFVTAMDIPSLYHPDILKGISRETLIKLMDKGDIKKDKEGKLGVSKKLVIATYGYAVTAHKSQGSQWETVYVDQDYVAPSWNAGRWYYTAITRTSDKVKLLHRPGVYRELDMETARSEVVSEAPQIIERPGTTSASIVDAKSAVQAKSRAAYEYARVRGNYGESIPRPMPESARNDMRFFNAEIKAHAERFDRIRTDKNRKPELITRDLTREISRDRIGGLSQADTRLYTNRLKPLISTKEAAAPARQVAPVQQPLFSPTPSGVEIAATGETTASIRELVAAGLIATAVTPTMDARGKVGNPIESVKQLNMEQAAAARIASFEGRTGRNMSAYDDLGTPAIGPGIRLFDKRKAEIEKITGASFEDLKSGKKSITEAEYDALLNHFTKKYIAKARKDIAGFDKLSTERQVAIVDLYHWSVLPGFKNMLEAINEGDFVMAQLELRDSKLYRRSDMAGLRARVENTMDIFDRTYDGTGKRTSNIWADRAKSRDQLVSWHMKQKAIKLGEKEQAAMEHAKKEGKNKVAIEAAKIKSAWDKALVGYKAAPTFEAARASLMAIKDQKIYGMDNATILSLLEHAANNVPRMQTARMSDHNIIPHKIPPYAMVQEAGDSDYVDGTVSASVLNAAEVLNSIIAPSLIGGSNALHRILMKEQGKLSAILAEESAHYTKIIHEWALGDGGQVRAFITEKTKIDLKGNRGEGPELTRTTHASGATRNKLTEDERKLAEVVQAAAMASMEHATKDGKTDHKAALEVAHVITGIFTENDKSIYDVFPKEIADQLLEAKKKVMAGIKMDGKSRPEQLARDRAVARALHAAGIGIYQKVPINVGDADYRADATETLANGQEEDSNWRPTKMNWMVPVSMIDKYFRSSSYRQKLLDAGRDPKRMDIAELARETSERLENLYKEVTTDLPWFVSPDAPYLWHRENYVTHYKGIGFLGTEEKAARLALEKNIQAVLEKNMESHRLTLAASKEASGRVRSLTDASYKMLKFAFGLKGLHFKNEGQAISEIRSGAHKDIGLTPDMDYADLANFIHGEVYDRLLARLANAQKTLDDPIKLADGDMLEHPLALAKATGEMMVDFKNRGYSNRTKTRKYSTYEDAYMLGGYRPDSIGANEMLHKYASDIMTSTANRAMINQMLLTTDAANTPLVIPSPNLNYAGENLVTDVTWEAVAQNLSRYLGKPLDKTQSAKWNIDQMVQDHFVKNKGYTRVESPYPSVNAFYTIHRGRGGENILDAAMAGGEVAGILKHVFETPWQDPYGALKGIERANAWMKMGALQFSLFFPIAGLESLTALSHGEFWRQGGLKMLLEFEEAIKSEHPYVVELMKKGRKIGITYSDSSHPLSLPRGILEKDIAKMTDWVLTNIGKKAADNFEMIAKLPLKQTEIVFDSFFNSAKLWAAHFMAQKLEAEAEAAGLPFDFEEDMAPYVNYINGELGGVNWNKMSYMTPTWRRNLSLLMFSPNWSISAWRAAGGELLTGAFSKTYLSDQEFKHIMFRRWPTMMLGVITLVPAMVQALAYTAGRAFGPPDDDDEFFMFNNEEGRKFSADITPLVRNLPFYKGYPTGERRTYIRWGKQAYEIKRWLDTPWGSLTGKLSQPARWAIEQATGESAGGGGWELEFKDMGLAGLIMSEDGGFMGSRAGYTVQKFMPFSILAWSKHPDAAPFQLLGPTSKGISFRGATEAYTGLLETWAKAGGTDNIYKNKKVKANLEALGPAILDAANRNGYDGEKVLKSARGVVMKELYAKLYRAIDGNDKVSTEKWSRAILRVNGTIRSTQRSMKSRNFLYGKPRKLTDQQKEWIEDAFRNP